MKIKNVGYLALTLLGASLVSRSAFAAAPYGMEYQGGEALGSSNVIEDPSLAELTSLVSPRRGVKVSYSNSNKWIDGYLSFGEGGNNKCVKTKYIVVGGTEVSDLSNVYYDVSTGSYIERITIEEIKVDLVSPVNFFDKYFTTLAVYETGGSLVLGYTVFDSKEACEAGDTYAKIGDRSAEYINLNRKMYAKTNVSLYKDNTNNRLIYDGLWFGIHDIDHAASVKILNSNNLLTSQNMYAVSLSNLQPSDSTVTDRNKFVESGNYIYSEGNFSSDDLANVFVEVNQEAQGTGLDIVFGSGRAAAIAVSYWAKQYKVEYESENGRITGADIEDVMFNDTASGSAQEPNRFFRFSHWTADKDVTLDDGTVIKAGAPIMSVDTIKRVVVKEDLVFTAHNVRGVNKVTYVSDENGDITGEDNETLNSGDNPSGTTEESSKGYVFSHWIADKDVTLTDGTVIKAGEPITNEQIKEVVVDSDIKFTAIHEKEEAVAVPDTGGNTAESEFSALALGGSIAVSAALIIAGLGAHGLKIKRNKVTFN